VAADRIRPRIALASQTRTPILAGLALAALLATAAPAPAQVAIGFCQGAGGLASYGASFLICCPGDPATYSVDLTVGPVDCGSAAAVMGAMNAAVAGLMFGGSPIFGAPVPVPSPVPGQARFEYPLSPAFLASGCCIIGGSVDFDCGTMSLRINPPCDKLGIPPGGGRPTKLCLDSPPPPFPTTLVLVLEGCDAVLVPLDGTETPAAARAKVLSALLIAGYDAFLNDDDKIEIIGDCTGEEPTGVDEFGLAGGVPMPLGISICPLPTEPTGERPITWSRVKAGRRG